MSTLRLPPLRTLEPRDVPAYRNRSKKRSAASSRSRRQPDEPTFFVDRALGTLTVAEALRTAGCRVEIHDRHFAQDARDAEWRRSFSRRPISPAPRWLERSSEPCRG